jgi:hypothetical protein
MKESTEDMIVKCGANAPRVTSQQIESKIKECKFHRLTNVLTVCILTLENGYTVIGESACASPSNYNQEISERVARDNATNKVFELEGYLLKQKLYEGTI